jgi:hypothetical protein
MRRALLLIFLVQLLTRLLFVNLTGVNNNYSFQCDSYWLVKMADEATHGNFNFDIGRFIASPLFPAVCGTFKIFSPESWSLFLGLFQIALMSVSGLYIFKISLLLFSNEKLALLSSLLYAIFPLTMWYVNTYSQETLFQAFLIIFIYYLLAACKSKRIAHTIVAGIFFSLAYLTKSHLLIFAAFVPLIYFHSFRFTRKYFLHINLFALIAAGLSLPFGLYQYRHNGVYVLSSNGAAYQFYLGNTEAGYKTIVEVPDKSSLDFNRMKDITKFAGYFNGSAKKYDLLISAQQKYKQHVFFADAINWIKSHPSQFIRMKIYDAFFFFLPGVSYRHYEFRFWLISFLLSAPIYLMGYLTILRLSKSHFKDHCWIIYLMLTMLIFSTFWYVQNRFRTITLEPFYILYASYFLNIFLSYTKSGRKTMSFLEYLFFIWPRSLAIKKNIRAFLYE